MYPGANDENATCPQGCLVRPGGVQVVNMGALRNDEIRGELAARQKLDPPPWGAYITPAARF